MWAFFCFVFQLGLGLAQHICSCIFHLCNFPDQNQQTVHFLLADGYLLVMTVISIKKGKFEIYDKINIS